MSLVHTSTPYPARVSHAARGACSFAAQQRLDAEKLHIPDVLPAPKSLLQYDECESMYQFAFMLGTPPAVGPVKWHLTFDLEERRRKDEREAHVVSGGAT